MVADDGGGRLLGLVLPARLLADLDAEPVGTQQARHGGVVLEIGARRVAPRVATTAVLLPEQTPHGGTVLLDEAPLRPDAPVPVLGEGFGHLDTEAVEQEIVLVAVLGEQLGRRR